MSQIFSYMHNWAKYGISPIGNFPPLLICEHCVYFLSFSTPTIPLCLFPLCLAHLDWVISQLTCACRAWHRDFCHFNYAATSKHCKTPKPHAVYWTWDWVWDDGVQQLSFEFCCIKGHSVSWMIILFSMLANTGSDIRSCVKWVVSLVIVDSHLIFFGDSV